MYVCIAALLPGSGSFSHCERSRRYLQCICRSVRSSESYQAPHQQTRHSVWQADPSVLAESLKMDRSRHPGTIRRPKLSSHKPCKEPKRYDDRPLSVVQLMLKNNNKTIKTELNNLNHCNFGLPEYRGTPRQGIVLSIDCNHWGIPSCHRRFQY